MSLDLKLAAIDISTDWMCRFFALLVTASQTISGLSIDNCVAKLTSFLLKLAFNDPAYYRTVCDILAKAHLSICEYS